MTEWAETTLGEVLTLQRGFDLPSRLRKPGPYPIVSSSGVTGYHDEFKAAPPGVVIGRYGTLGTVHWVDQPYWPLNTSLWVKDFKGNDERFVSYLLQTINADGSAASAVPGVNRNHLHQQRVAIPGLELQRRIAALLSAFDALIEINARRIALLEGLGRSLYREWIVRFRFPGYESAVFVDSERGRIPEGWSVERLPRVADVKFGFPFKSKRFSDSGIRAVTRIRDIPKGATSTFTDEEVDESYLVVDGDILIGMDGDFHMRRWSGGESWLNQRVARVRPRNGAGDAQMLLLALERPITALNASIVGTTVAHLGKRHLDEIAVVSPCEPLKNSTSRTLDAVGSQALHLQQQIRRLATTRDLLLPRLVMGQIDLDDIDLGDLLPAEAA